MIRQPLEIGVAQQASPGEVLSGDRYFLWQSDTRAVLGVIDGLGHGAEAALAAEAARAALDEPAGQSLRELILRCHERLRGTRGATMTLIGIDTVSWLLEWIGVGNVVGVLLHPEGSGQLSRTELFVRGGVAGRSLPSTTASIARIARGDMVVVATDGVRSGFAYDINRIEAPQPLAERLLAQHHTGYDDALIVAARIQRGET